MNEEYFPQTLWRFTQVLFSANLSNYVNFNLFKDKTLVSKTHKKRK